MSSLYVTEAGSFIKRNGGHVVVGRNNEVLFEVPLERIEDIKRHHLRHLRRFTGCQGQVLIE